jgi:AmmeMemoRadiSam system protein B
MTANGKPEMPKLRPVEVAQAVLDGRPAVALLDPLRIAEGPVVVARETAFLLQYFDGEHSLRDIQVEYTRRVGTLLFTDQLERLIARLDHAYLLDTPRFHRRERELQEAFSRSPVRPAILAGTGYAAETHALRGQIASYFASAGAPRRPPQSRPRGILAPHIDLRQGGTAFAAAYAEIAPHEPPELCVILGTGHFGVDNLFAGTAKAFETPLGLAPTDAGFVSELAGRWDRDLFADELVHRTEHSIELQVLFIQYLWQGAACPSIVPLLCGFSHAAVTGPGDREEEAAIESFIDALRTTAEAYGKSLLFVASADLAHIGPRYGDHQPPDFADLGRITDQDQEFLALVAKMDKEGSLAHVAEDDNRRRICGFAPIYTMLGAMDASEGELLRYEKAEMDGAGSWVTFASMVFR